METFKNLYEELLSILSDNTPGYSPNHHYIQAILLKTLAALAALEKEGKL